MRLDKAALREAVRASDEWRRAGPERDLDAQGPIEAAIRAYLAVAIPLDEQRRDGGAVRRRIIEIHSPALHWPNTVEK